ncbi:MAG: hypothetical protein C0404_05365 [Verrucomicrobia bacterium]|nr:hypothetical protein [Verrucomicrobiota bacterium]
MPLAGYPGVSRTSTGLRDPLLASAVHLRGGSGGIIIISLDLLHIDPPFAHRIRQGVCEATGTREQNVFVVANQNHSGPAACKSLYLQNDPSYSEPPAGYLDTVLKQSVLAASEAAVASCPASIAFIQLDKPGCGAMIVKSDKGRLIGLVVVSDQAPRYHGPANTQVSSDFLHVLRQKLAARFGGAPVVAYLVAPSGDSILDDPPAFGEGPVSAAGEAMASLIVTRVKALKPGDFTANLEMGGRLHDIPTLSPRVLPSLMDAASAVAVASDEVAAQQKFRADPSMRRIARWTMTEASRTMGFVVAQQKGLTADIIKETQTAQLHEIQIGKVRILGIPGAVTAECGRVLLSMLGDNTWLAEGHDGDLQGSILYHDPRQKVGYRLLSGLLKPEIGNLLAALVISFSTRMADRPGA